MNKRDFKVNQITLPKGVSEISNTKLASLLVAVSYTHLTLPTTNEV